MKKLIAAVAVLALLLSPACKSKEEKRMIREEAVKEVAEDVEKQYASTIEELDKQIEELEKEVAELKQEIKKEKENSKSSGD